MKHVWVVESSGGRKWRPAYLHFTRKWANSTAKTAAKDSPGLKWRVAKYERVK